VQADDIEPEPYVEEDLEPESEPAPKTEAEKATETEAAVTAGDGSSVGAMIFDCAVLRPFGFVATLVGGVFFVPAAVLASGVVFVPPTAYFEHPDRARVVEGIQAAWEHFVVPQAENTFTRPLGEF
jgi:hypothetical protein